MCEKTVIFSFTARGGELAKQICAQLPAAEHVWNYSENSLQKQTQAAFQTASCLIFVGAAGIAVRAIAPFVKAKDRDPAVVVADESGRFFIPILSGHIGGANQMAQLLAQSLGGQAVLTTATDVNRCFAVDTWAKEMDLHIVNLSGVKIISAALLRGERVGFTAHCPLEGPLPPFFKESQPDGRTPTLVLCDSPPQKPLPKTLYLIPKIYALGVGCRKNISPAGLEATLLHILQTQNIPVEALRAVASIDLKSEEKALLDFCEKYRLPLEFYTPEQLSLAPGTFTPSAFVQKTTGVDNVCERSASLLTGGGAPILQKTAADGVTAALARYNWRCSFVSCPNRR